MIREPPRSKRNYTLFPFTPLFRSVDGVDAPGQARQRYLRIERDRQFARNGRRPHRRFDRLDAPVRYRVDGRGAVPRTRRYERWGRRWRRGAMSDLLGIGASGLRAYSAALATIGDNIANAQSPGFARRARSEEHTSELQSLIRISYAGF